MTLFEALSLMITFSPWSIKVSRESDPDVAMIMEFTGSFLLGPKYSRRKRDFSDPLRLSKNLIQAQDYQVLQRDCKWSD